jgi:phosphatidylserine decarboxylase
VKVVYRRAASALTHVFLQEDINFLVTNRIPRRYATLLLGWFSRIRSRRLTRICVATWSLFDDLRLEEAKTQDFECLRDCFVRELREGARHIDRNPCIVTSPCDAVVGAFGSVREGQAIQAKGSPYLLKDLLCDERLVQRHGGGSNRGLISIAANFDWGCNSCNIYSVKTPVPGPYSRTASAPAKPACSTISLAR